MTSTTLNAPAVAARFALAVTAPEQAEVLRLALDERDRTVQALQEAVYNLEQTSIRRDEQYAAHSASTSTLGHQVKALKEDTAERATKGDVRELRTELKNDVALVRKDIEVLRTELKDDVRELRTELKNDVALVRTDMEMLRTELKNDVALVRTDMEMLRTELKNDVALVHKEIDVLRAETKVGFSEMETRFAKTDAKVEALENRLIVKLGGIVAVAIGAVVALLRVFPAG